jgi:hypothetical protein
MIDYSTLKQFALRRRTRRILSMYNMVEFIDTYPITHLFSKLATSVQSSNAVTLVTTMRNNVTTRYYIYDFDGVVFTVHCEKDAVGVTRYTTSSIVEIPFSDIIPHEYVGLELRANVNILILYIDIKHSREFKRYDVKSIECLPSCCIEYEYTHEIILKDIVTFGKLLKMCTVGVEMILSCSGAGVTVHSTSRYGTITANLPTPIVIVGGEYNNHAIYKHTVNPIFTKWFVSNLRHIKQVSIRYCMRLGTLFFVTRTNSYTVHVAICAVPVCVNPTDEKGGVL